jgi:hypothetical protein
MKIMLRVERPETTDETSKRTRKKKPIYTPAVIDETKIGFAFIDDDGDVNIRMRDDDTYYSAKNIDNLFDRICDMVNNRRLKIKGFSQ